MNIDEIPLPNLDRPEVQDRKKNNGADYLDTDAYGTYTLALKHFRFEPGKRNNPHYRADCVIVASTNDAWPVGRQTAIHFHTGRSGTATDPGKPERDDRFLEDFIRAIYKVARPAKFPEAFGPKPATEAMKKLLAKGKIADDTVQFRFIRKPGNTTKIYDKKADKLNEVTFPKDSFEVV